MTVTRSAERWGLLALFTVDAVLLALIELFYLPLRLDGTILPRLGDVMLPLSVLLAVVTTPLLVSRASALVGRRPAAVPLVAWILTIAAVGLRGPGGDVVLLPDWRTFLLLAGGALPGAIALGGTLGRRARKVG